MEPELVPLFLLLIEGEHDEQTDQIRVLILLVSEY